MNAASSNKNTLTLGDLLFADPSIAGVGERDWLALVHAMGAGNEAALRRLHQKTYPVVFTYLFRLTGDRDRASELILDVYQDIWCEAPIFDGVEPVLGWIMRLARTAALSTRSTGSCEQPPISEDHRLRRALATLTVPEREAIEASWLDGLSYSEMAAQWHEPIGTIKSRIRSGLAKLHQAL